MCLGSTHDVELLEKKRDANGAYGVLRRNTTVYLSVALALALVADRVL